VTSLRPLWHGLILDLETIPAITSLTWDLNEMSRIAAKILLDRIRNGDGAADARPVYLPIRFILRHSCAAPARG